MLADLAGWQSVQCRPICSQAHLRGGYWRKIANARGVAQFHLTSEFTKAAENAEKNRICPIVAAA